MVEKIRTTLDSGLRTVVFYNNIFCHSFSFISDTHVVDIRGAFIVDERATGTEDEKGQLATGRLHWTR